MQPINFPFTFDGSGNLILTGIHAPNGAWSIDDTGHGAFDTVSVVQPDGLVVDGTDILTTLTNRPSGLEAYDLIQSGTSTALIGTTETVCFRGSTSNVFNVRIYRFDMQCHVIPSGTISGSLRVRYTTDGSTPDATSALLVRYAMRAVDANGFSVSFFKYYSPGSDYDQIRFCITLQTSSGTMQIQQTNGELPLEFGWVDVGLDYVVGNGNLAQISKSSGSPDPDPTTTYTTTWSALDSASFDSSGGNRVGYDHGYCYQGYYSGTNGNQFSLITFDYASIQSHLSGATVNKTEVYLNNNQWYNNSGGTAVIGDHTYASVSGNASYSNVNPNISQSSFSYGQAKWVTVSNTIGNDLKNNSAKGIALGKGPSNSHTYYGAFAGNGQSGEPKVRITYTK